MSSKYRPDIDGLRAIAVLSVVVFHAFPASIKGGFVGVDIFFVISGYLISSIIYKGLMDGSFGFVDFYIKRTRRIFPALLTVLIVCLLFGWFSLLADEYEQLGKHVAAGAGFISNIIFWNESGYFDSSSATKILLHLWSLGIEEQFYIVWPLLVWISWKLKVNWFFLVSVIIAISFSLNIYSIASDEVAAFYSPITRFWELLIGGLLAYYETVNVNISKKLESKPNINTVIFKILAVRTRFHQEVKSILGIVLIILSTFFINEKQAFPGYFALLPTIGTALVLSAGPLATINRNVLSSRVLVFIGSISYPLYLWHWPTLTFARILESKTPDSDIKIVAVFISIILAWLTYKFIENPIRFGRQGVAKSFFLIFTLVAVGLSGYAIYKNNGLETRASEIKFSAQNIEQQFEEKCSLEFKNIPKTHCAEIGADENIALIIGDSHVRHYFEILKSQVIESGLGVVAISKGGCPFFLDTNVPNVKECLDANNEVIDYIQGNKDRIKVIFMAGQYSTYVRSGALLDEKRKSRGFSEALRATMKKLEDHNVIFLDQIPPISFDPKICIDRPFSISDRSTECRNNKADVMLALDSYRSQSNEVIYENKNLYRFDVDDILCGEDFCEATDDGSLLYYDRTHLNPNGVSFVKNSLNIRPLLQLIEKNSPVARNDSSFDVR